MEKLINKYNEECSFKSKLVNRLWNIGYIVILIIFIFRSINGNNYLINIFLLFTFSIILFLSCNLIMLKKIANKLNIEFSFKELIFKRKSRMNMYQKLDEFQKKWITNYCKNNKINTIEKLKVIREELGKNNNIIKYINPTIVGTLSVASWGLICDQMSEKIGTLNTSLIGIIGAFIISIVINAFRKEWKEQVQFMNTFNKYAGYDRLKELILYRILKSNK